MIYKNAKKLALQSFDNNILNQKKVNLIEGKLKSSDMKKYIKALKLIERKNTIYLVLPNEKIKNGVDYAIESLKKMYPGKKIEYLYDKSLMAGIKIINDDLIYEYNIGNTINNIFLHLNQKNYD